MKFIHNMKIGQKLTVGFLVMAIISTLIGTVGIYSVNMIGSSSKDMYNNNFTVMGDLGSLRADFLTDSVRIRNLSMCSIDKRASYITLLDLTAKKIPADLENLGKYMKSAADIKTYNDLKAVIVKYSDDRDSIRALILSNASVTESSKLIMATDGDGKIASDFMATLYNSNVARAKQVSIDNAKMMQSQMLLMILICIGAIGLAIILGLFLTKIIVKPIKKLKEYANRIAIGAVDIKIENESKDEVGDLMASFRKMTENIKANASAAQKIADGDLSIEVSAKSEEDILAISMMCVINTVKELTDKINQVSNMAEEGTLLTFITEKGSLLSQSDAGKFKGSFKDIVLGVDRSLDAIIAPLNTAAGYVDKISRGEMPEKITELYKGDYNTIKNNLNNCIDNITALIEDADMLSAAAEEGKLSVRADAAKHQGDFKKIVEGINATLDAVIVPIEEAGKVLSRIAVNDLELKMSDQYKGSLNDLSSYINNVRVRLLSVEDAFVKVSLGDTSRLSEFKKVGKRSENDRLMPAATAMMQAVEDLIAESKILSQAAVEGNLSARGNAGHFSGGYKEIIEGMNQTMEAIERPLGEISQVLSTMENSDFTVTMDGEYKGEYLRIKEATNNTIKAISEVLTDMGQASDQVAGGSKQVSDASQSLSQGASEQASAVEQLSASITEVAAQTRQNAANATEANELTNNAKKDADIGAAQMLDMIKSMEEINESSIKVAKVIKVIDDIAFQTNMLALNAAVEAARAGQHGKGFAVVADEVRNLAARSANAVKETSEMIENSLKRAADGTKIANETKAALDKIVVGVDKATVLVAEIAAASNEQATGIAQINRGIEQVAQVVQTNSATSEESAASSEELSGQAELLKQMVGKFKLNNSSERYVPKPAMSPRAEFAQAAATKSPRKITLNQNNFGKY